jgi:large subunit ribosomal protein L21
MFAVVKTGGKQYRVAPEDKLRVARLAGEPGQIVELKDVLLVGGDVPVIGNPVLGATVAAEVIAHERGAKVIAFKKRRRKNSRRKRGYRDEYTLIRITEILTDGKKPSLTAMPRAERKPKPAAPEAEAADADAATDTAAKKPVKKPAAKSKAAAAKKPAKPKAAAKSKRKTASKGKKK